MDSKSRQAVSTEVFGNVVRNTFHSDKCQYFSILRTDLIKMFDQLGALLKVAADFDDLLDIVVGSKIL